MSSTLDEQVTENKVFLPLEGDRNHVTFESGNFKLENFRPSMKLVNPVFYSYLGFGLKAARLATLGALETEGSSGYRCWLGYGESDIRTQLAFSLPWQ